MSRQSPIGQVIHARDGGLHAPLDRAGFDYIQAQSADGGRKWEVKGTAIKYGVVGHFSLVGGVAGEGGCDCGGTRPSSQVSGDTWVCTLTSRPAFWRVWVIRRWGWSSVRTRLITG